LFRSSTLFRFEGHFVQRQRVTIETDDTTEILASKLIEKLTYNVETGLYVFDVQGEVNKNAIVPILLRTEDTGKASWNNVPNKTLLVGTFLCAVVGTLRSRFCVPDTVLDVPDIIWNILPNIIWHIFLISDL